MNSAGTLEEQTYKIQNPGLSIRSSIEIEKLQMSDHAMQRKHINRSRSHPPDLGLPNVSLQTRAQVLPPTEQRRGADQLEPWRELQRVDLEHFFQGILGDIFDILYFVWINVQVNVGLDEEDVVDCGLCQMNVMRNFLTKTHFHVHPISRR